MDSKKAADARSRIAHGISEAAGGMADLIALAFQDIAEVLKGIDWSELAKLKEADPDLFSWAASGPIRRVQLRRARPLREGKRHGV